MLLRLEILRADADSLFRYAQRSRDCDGSRSWPVFFHIWAVHQPPSWARVGSPFQAQATHSDSLHAVRAWVSTRTSLSRQAPLPLISPFPIPPSNSAQVVGANGSGNVSYRTALTAVFVEGLVFIVLALTGMRQWLVKLIPATIKTATGVGIGFFLTEIGLSYSAGIGAITSGGTSTPLALGGCPPDMIDLVSGICDGSEMSNLKVCIVAGARSQCK